MHTAKATEDDALPLTMEAFLAQIEKKAYRMAVLGVGAHADALDVLQDSMIKLVSNYQQRPPQEWKPLFYKILQNRIRDWQRQQKVKNMVFFWRSAAAEQEDEEWPPAGSGNLDTPEGESARDQLQEAVLEQLKSLPAKQQQCVLLRSWEGFSVAETADIMGCSEGSVKTHYSRAMSKLKSMLETEHDITF